MATMKDVAAMAGVSFTTVSHVVNRTRPVSDAVRKKVEDAIAQLHYVPSAVARSLKVRTTSIIGLLVPNSTNPYFAELSRGIEDCCERNGYCVILCNSDDNPQKQANYLRVLQEKRIDGLVLASAGGDGALAKGLANMRTPTVIVDREVEGVEADRVQIDHEMGAYLATRHLLELGHRDIACIGGPLSTKVSTLRVEGYRRAMAKAGLEVHPQWLLESEFSSPGGYHAALGLLGGEGERPTAIVAGNDMIGIGVLRAAAELNIRVPHELSVIGFDDIELSRFVFPALTTVGQSIRLLGEIAAQLLLQRIAEREEPMQRRVVAPALVLRESTAPPLVRVNRAPGAPSLERGWNKDATMQAKVLVVGSLNMDLVVRAPRLPRGGETLAGQSFITVPGGKGANQAVAAARLGAEVAMIGCLGDDAYGDQLYRALQAEGIDCQGVERVAGESSGVALIVVDDSSQNAIVIVAGGNGHLSPAVLARHEHMLEQAQVVVCQLESPLETVGHVLRRAHALGKTVILNPAPATRDVPAEWLPLADYLVPNETESELLCRLPVDSLESAGRAAERLREMGAGRVIVTLGAQGALLVGEGRVEHFPVARVKALDTTAAGDTFVGGFAAALARGLDEAAAIRFGQAAAAISVTRLGAQTSIPSREEVERALAGEA